MLEGFVPGLVLLIKIPFFEREGRPAPAHLEVHTHLGTYAKG